MEGFALKNNLIYQTSEYDCGTACLVNALRYLYERDEIIPEVLKAMYTFSLDCFDDDGKPGFSGTSKACMHYIAYWLNHYSKTHTFQIKAKEYSDQCIKIEESNGFGQFLKKGGCILLRVWLETGHYILLTGIDSENIYLFDPYYEEMGTKEYDFLSKVDGVTIVHDHPKQYNRIVKISRINDLTNDYYHQGPIKKHQALCICNPKQCDLSCLPANQYDPNF